MDVRELRIEIEGSSPDVEVTPSRVPFHVLTDIVRGFVDAILATADLDDQGAAAAAEALCLTRIEPGSARPILEFPAELEGAADQVLEVLESRDYSQVGVTVNKALHRSFTLALSRRWNLRLRRRGWREDAPAVVLSELAPVPEPPEPIKPVTLRGETVLYGRVVSIGGDKPKVTIKPVDGRRQVHASCTMEVAIALAGRLYQTVGVAGVAEWDATTLELEAFTVHSLTDYKDTPVAEALRRIREAAGGAYDDPRVLEDLRSLRSDR